MSNCDHMDDGLFKKELPFGIRWKMGQIDILVYNKNRSKSLVYGR